MSEFTNQLYDNGSTQRQYQESISPGLYHINKPQMRAPSDQIGGQADVVSELYGQTIGGQPYVASKDPKAQFNPLTNNRNFNTPELRNSLFTKEYTRMDNPPSNIKGMAPNRFSWLCLDPQDKVAFNVGDSRLPFSWNICSRTIAKDNNRPCLPTPFDQYAVFPRPRNECLLPSYLSHVNYNMCDGNQVRTNFCGGVINSIPFNNTAINPPMRNPETHPATRHPAMQHPAMQPPHNVPFEFAN